MTFDQQEFDIRCEWGEHGVAVLAPISDAVVVVDVLSFSTSVEVAVSNGAVVFPYRGRADAVAEFAAARSAEVADPVRSGGGYSLSPASLRHIRPGTRIVLPSPNGSTLSLAAGPTPVLAGCLRNARAVAFAARQLGPRITVIAAGERWLPDYSLRPSWEDLVGAGAIISHLDGRLSPESAAALAAFRDAEPRLGEYLHRCGSGKELVELGFAEDVRLAAELDVSDCAPLLTDEAYIRAESRD
jgi:2-phosphosulfolactate phosphatase